jgi:hypothetical protein
MASTKDILKDKAEQIRHGAELIASTTNDWQMVREYLCNRLSEGIELNEIQTAKLKRYQYVYDNMSSGKYNELDIVGHLENVFGIKRTQAVQDIQDAQELFATTLNINKRFEIKMELEINKDARKKALANGDYKSAAAFSKIIQTITKDLPDVDPEAGKRFAGHTFVFTADPRVLGKPLPTKGELNKLMKDINTHTGKSLSMDFIDDLEFEEEA